jgi:hypothetical protein
MAGCFSADQEISTPLNISFAKIIPAEWKPVGDWRELNIDNDAEVEYLLLYHYDFPANTNTGKGPIGGMVYDTQTRPLSQRSAIPIPAIPSAYLVPYRLLPSYWKGAGQGYLAEPGVAEANIKLLSVKRTRPEEQKMGSSSEGPVNGKDGKGAPLSSPTKDELIVMGGDNRISVFWWKSKLEGYGVAHVHAGWLTIDDNDGWEGEKERSPIRKIEAFYPQNDRSLLCKHSIFTRELDPANTTESSYRPAIKYTESPPRLEFCYGIPQTPFYPEGVAIAYVLSGADSRRQYLDSTADVEKIEKTLALGGADSTKGEYYIQSVMYPAAVLQNAYKELVHEVENIYASVDVNVVYHPDAEREQRTYHFVLKYFPPNRSDRTTAHWLITGLERTN